MDKKILQEQSAEDRLNKLLLVRLHQGSDRERIDEMIWDLFGETWAVMFTDLVGFSRSVQRFGIIYFLQLIIESERLFGPIVERHAGYRLKKEGDSLLIIFRKPAKALAAALAMQQACKEYNTTRKDEEKLFLSLGLGYGQVLKIGLADVFGFEVNAASKLGEDTGTAGDILVTKSFYEQIADPGRFAQLPDIAPWVGGAYRLLYEQQQPS